MPQKPRLPSIPKVCVVCDQPFLASVAKRRACSPKCGNILGKINGDAGRKRNSEARRQRVCEVCSARFVMRNASGRARAGKSHEGRFCSRSCARAERRISCNVTT